MDFPAENIYMDFPDKNLIVVKRDIRSNLRFENLWNSQFLLDFLHDKIR